MLKIRQLFMVFFAVAVSLFAANWTENERQALNEAIGDARKSIDLNGAFLREKNLLLMPLQGDQENYLFNGLKTMLRERQLTVVEEQDSKALDAAAKEFAWNERMQDLLIPETLVKFGKMLGAQVIICGRIRELSVNAERVYAELELFATQIDTRKVLWSGIFAGRFAPGGNVIGRFSENPHVVFGIKQAFKLFDASLKSSMNIQDIRSRSVAVLDLAGDSDKYVGKRTYELLTENGVTPRELGFSTLTQARAYIRDNKLKADAYLYGAVRAMYSQEQPDASEREVDLKTRKTTVHHKVFVEVELRIVDASNEDILWAKSVAESFDDVETRNATVRELEIQKQIDGLLNQGANDKSDDEKIKQAEELRRTLAAEQAERERMENEAAAKAETDKHASQMRMSKGILWGIGGVAALALILFILRGMMSNVKIR